MGLDVLEIRLHFCGISHCFRAFLACSEALPTVAGDSCKP